MNINYLRRITPRWIIFLIDISVCFFSIIIAYYLRFNFAIPKSSLATLPYVVALVIVIRSISFYIGKTYKGMVRYTGIKDITRIIIVIFLGSVSLIMTNLICLVLIDKYLIPLSIIIIDFLLTVAVLLFIRLIIKLLFLEFNSNRNTNENVFIYGTNELALITKKVINNDSRNSLKVVGFIDHHDKVIGNKIDGISVFHLNQLSKTLLDKDVSFMIISDKGISLSHKRFLIDACLKHDIKIKTIPDVSSWINGEFNLSQLRDVRIEDLLGRPEISINKKDIEKNISNKIVLVTGAAGSIGSEIVRQLTLFNPEKIILLDTAETPLYEIDLEIKEDLNFEKIKIKIGDVRNKLLIEHIFEKYKPNYVFHCAAYKHVPMMENNPTEAIRTNVLGTKIIADAAIKFSADKFVMISTDKAVNPTNVMGASKRIAEIYIQSFNNNNCNTKFITTRFGNVLGSNGSVIPRFKKQIESGGPITITHPEITRYFMTIPEACRLVLEAGNMGNGGEIYIFDMGTPIKILDLAKKMIALSGLTPNSDIAIKYTGLRPGEKLYEELLADSENTTTTHHSQIMIAKVREYQPDKVNCLINELIETTTSFDNNMIVKKMKQIVPEFLSQNSEFSKLD